MSQTATEGLQPDHHNYQQCFIGHSQGASWRKPFEQVCGEVLPQFGLKPWYADKQYQGSIPLRQKVVNMIATTRYGMYDLSSWRKNDQGPWIMPRNVLIELGMAIALNRPMLLLRHGKNRECGLGLPACLEGIDIGEFSDGKKMLKETLHARLPSLTQGTPKQDWHNRYCHFGGLECSYREAHPQARQWGRQKIHIHVADGTNVAHSDCRDFHEMIEEGVMSRLNDLDFHYLDSLPCPQGCTFLLCSRCQEVRSSPFAIYRMTPDTSADTFIAIGMSIALEKQFNYTITKILITNDANSIPSLLKGYEIIEEQDYTGIQDRLNVVIPQIIEETKRTNWKPQPLPFEVFIPPKAIPAPDAAGEQAAKSETPEASETGIADASPEVEGSAFVPGMDVCPFCDAETRPGDNFCLNCGNRLSVAILTQRGVEDEGSAPVPATGDRIERPSRFLLQKDSGEVLGEYTLEKHEIRIGRAPDADIVLNQDKLTSRRHATVWYENGQYTLRDERSANGTFINGRQIKEVVPRVLKDGDRVGIGEYELIYHTFDSVINTPEKSTINQPVNVCILYAQEDRALLIRLEQHLKPLERGGFIRIWSDLHIGAGEHIMQETDKQVNTADIILPLISPDFMASDYLYGRATQNAEERFKNSRFA